MLLLSRDSSYAYLNGFIAAEITTTIRHIPVEVELGHAEGLPRACVANFDNVHSVSRDRLIVRAGRLSPARVSAAKRALGYALDWPELKSA